MPVTLEWLPATLAGSYDVQVDSDPTFSAPVEDRSGVATTDLVVDGLSVGSTYYWRVRAQNGAGAGPWSAAWTFHAVAAGDPPTAGFADDVEVRLSYPSAPVRPVHTDYTVPAGVAPEARPTAPTATDYTVPVGAGPDAGPQTRTANHVAVAVATGPDTRPESADAVQPVAVDTSGV